MNPVLDNDGNIDFCDCIASGWKYWYQNGQIHRDNDLPAVQSPNGSKYWYINGQLHRDNDLPSIEYYTGTKEWYIYSYSYTEKEFNKKVKALK